MVFYSQTGPSAVTVLYRDVPTLDYYLDINPKNMKHIEISLWMKFDQFDLSPGKILPRRALQQFIHRVVHILCG